VQIKWKRWAPIIYISPAFIYMFFAWIIPFIYSLELSLHRWNLASLTIEKKFIGFSNYAEIIGNPEFWNAVRRTITYVCWAIGLEFLLGLVIALLISRESRLMSVIRRLILIPFMIAPAVVGLMWMWIYNPEWGVLNYFVRTLGIHKVGYSWLGDTSVAMFSIVVVDIWQWTPFVILLFLAGIASLPRDPYDAARVDGASRWQIIKFITLPMLKPVMMIVLLIRTMTIFKFFDTIFILTHGGPASVTEVLGFHLYRVSFMYFKMGYAAALSYVMLIIVIAVCLLLIKLLK